MLQIFLRLGINKYTIIELLINTISINYKNVVTYLHEIWDCYYLPFNLDGLYVSGDICGRDLGMKKVGGVAIARLFFGLLNGVSFTGVAPNLSNKLIFEALLFSIVLMWRVILSMNAMKKKQCIYKILQR